MRALAGVHVGIEHSNAYFTFTRDPQYPDAKASIVPSWCNESEMNRNQHGKSRRPELDMSKAITLERMGDSHDNPVITVLALRTWSLWRCRQWM